MGGMLREPNSLRGKQSLHDDFDSILDACLEKMRVRHASAADCLKQYPEHAETLRPLLGIAAEIGLVPEIRPSAEFKRATRRHVANLSKPSRRQELESRVGALRDTPTKIAVVCLLAFAPLILSGLSIIYLSRAVLPGNPLYSVKRSVENVQLSLAPNEIARGSLHTILAERRLDEIRALSESGQSTLADQAVLDYGHEVAGALESFRSAPSSQDSPQVRSFGEELLRQHDRLTQETKVASAPAKNTLQHALMVLERFISQSKPAPPQPD